MKINDPIATLSEVGARGLLERSASRGANPPLRKAEARGLAALTV
jgi:hypothetical protein